jgi:N4-(beta-N-acetylglucosaminyl)-L-asparaginase
VSVSRRDFLSAATASATLQTGEMTHEHAAHEHPKPVRPTIPRLPALLSRMAGTVGIDAAYTMLKQGRDTLDAALHVTKTQEDDPGDVTAGLGGLPNEEGEVQLEACCFHGPTRRLAAVAAVSGIRNASLLARAVMEHTACPLLVGSGAQRFGIAHGFVKEDLSTERARQTWAVWKELRSSPNPYPASQKELDLLVRKFEPVAARAGVRPRWTWRVTYDALFPAARPLYVSTVKANGEMSSAATTSGLPWRLAGAASDISTLGAGCYLDAEIGSAGASGTAEANIKIAGAHLIVENMRRGMSPEMAGMDALRRIVQWHRNDMTALRLVEIVYYILRKDGAYGCVSLWHGDRTGHVQRFTIHDGVRRSEDCLFLLEGSPSNAGANS